MLERLRGDFTFATRKRRPSGGIRQSCKTWRGNEVLGVLAHGAVFDKSWGIPLHTLPSSASASAIDSLAVFKLLIHIVDVNVWHPYKQSFHRRGIPDLHGSEVPDSMIRELRCRAWSAPYFTGGCVPGSQQWFQSPIQPQIGRHLPNLLRPWERSCSARSWPMSPVWTPPRPTSPALPRGTIDDMKAVTLRNMFVRDT